MKKSIISMLAFVVVALVLLSSCASSFELAGNALARGDYSIAIKQSLKSIEKEKDVYEAEAVLQEAWKRANSEWNAQITTIEQSTTSGELSKSMTVYDKLLEVHNAVAKAGRSDLNPTYSEILEKANQTSERIIGMLFEEGSATLAIGGRAYAQAALQNFKEVKAANPNYPGIDAAIEEATNQATIKVFVLAGLDKNPMNRGYDLVAMVENQFLIMDFVEVVGLPNRPLVPMNDSKTAMNLAKASNADILVHFESSTEYDSGMKRERRPLDSRVTAAPNWEVEKLYVLTSGKSDVHYKVVDLKTEKILAEKTLAVEKSTDHDFYVTSILHSGTKKNLQLGNMPTAPSLNINTLAPGFTSTDIGSQISAFESKDVAKVLHGIQMAGHSTMGIKFSNYQLPSQLAKIEDLNGHTFALFNFIEFDSPVPGEGKGYTTFYEEVNSSATGTYARLISSANDQYTYTELVEWMKDRNLKTAVKKEFMTTFHEDLIPRKVAEWVSPVLE